jgi:uncharacterized protein YkwD
VEKLLRHGTLAGLIVVAVSMAVMLSAMVTGGFHPPQPANDVPARSSVLAVRGEHVVADRFLDRRPPPSVTTRPATPSPVPTLADRPAGRPGGVSTLTPQPKLPSYSELLGLVNDVRIKAGCGPVVPDSDLSDAARFPDAERDTAVAVAGYNAGSRGENRAGGNQTARDIIRSWLSDPAERRTVLDCSFTNIGAAWQTAPQGPWVLHILAARAVRP